MLTNPEGISVALFLPFNFRDRDRRIDESSRHYPGFPSLLVTYNVSNDYFFSRATPRLRF
jgi:hypothetical protein